MNIKQCCNAMNKYIHEPGVQVFYDEVIRYYYIPILRNNKIVLHQGLIYCPWCGSKLPSSLSEEYYDILEKEYGLDNNAIDGHPEKIPVEFKSDEWWIKRGL